MLEQVCTAACDAHQLPLANKCCAAIASRFPRSGRVAVLRGLILEAEDAAAAADGGRTPADAQGAAAEKYYRQLLKDAGASGGAAGDGDGDGDGDGGADGAGDASGGGDRRAALNAATVGAIKKRLVCIAKARGDRKAAIDLLNDYIANVSNGEAAVWAELAGCYLSLMMYKQAAFCYEELILIEPQNYAYHLKYAEVLYSSASISASTAGGGAARDVNSIVPLVTARKYFCSAVELSGGDDVRSLYLLALCCLEIMNVTNAASVKVMQQMQAALAKGIPATVADAAAAGGPGGQAPSAPGSVAAPAADELGPEKQEVGVDAAKRLVQIYTRRCPEKVGTLKTTFAKLLLS